jgi:hypothetical protein
MHSEDNTTPPTNGSLYGFFNRIYRQLSGTESVNNVPELRQTHLDIQLQPLVHTDFIGIDLMADSFRELRELDMQRHIMLINPIADSFRERETLELDYERRRARESLIERVILLPPERNWGATFNEEAAYWWAHGGRSKMESELACPLASLNSTRLENYADLVIDLDFICGISLEIMTNPVYDPAFPNQKYDLLVIREWLKEQPTNPCTRTPLSTENLVYDELLKERIDQFVNSVLAQRSCQF